MEFPWAQVGRKVVCLHALWNRGIGEITPVEGGVYTIRAVELSPQGKVGLRFVEIVNAPRHYLDDYGETIFYAGLFRPLTDITVFKDMLKRAPKKVTEDA